MQVRAEGTGLGKPYPILVALLNRREVPVDITPFPLPTGRLPSSHSCSKLPTVVVVALVVPAAVAVSVSVSVSVTAVGGVAPGGVADAASVVVLPPPPQGLHNGCG